MAQGTQLGWHLKMPLALVPLSAAAAREEPAKAANISATRGRSPLAGGGHEGGIQGWVEQLTLLSLLVLGSVWLTCRSEYLGGFLKGLLISQGTDSVRTNLAGLRREQGEKGMERRGREMERHQSFEGVLGVTLRLQTALELLSKAIPHGSSSRSAPAPGWQPAFGLPPAPRLQPNPPWDVGGLKPPMVGCKPHPSPPAEGLQFREAQQPPRPPHEPGGQPVSGGGTVLFLAAAFQGGGKEPAQSSLLLAETFFGGKPACSPGGHGNGPAAGQGI